MTAYAGFITTKGRSGELGSPRKALGYITLGAADANGTTVSTLATTDTITWTNIIPGKFKVIGGAIWGVEPDVHATPTGTLKIGNSDDDDGYLVTTGEAVGLSNSLAEAWVRKFDGALLGTTISNGSIVLTPVANVATIGSGKIWIELEVEGV